MKKILIFTTFFLTLGASLFAQQNEDYKKHPGYVEFGDIEELTHAEKTVEVLLKGPILRFVANAAQNVDPSMARLVRTVELIKVDTFSIEKEDLEDMKKIIRKVSKKMDTDKWERMVRVKEEDEVVEIFVQFGEADELRGLVIMAIGEDDKAVFVNMAGSIDPSQLGRLAEKFDVPEVGSIDIEKSRDDD
jgi:hypothetical protein